jgi:Ras-related C3 botulinum toxin substrate 1
MVDGHPIQLGLWDTAGHDKFDHLRPLSYSQTDVFVLIYSIASPSSFKQISQKWVPEVRRHAPKTPYVLLGTKLELRNDKNAISKLKRKKLNMVTTEEAMELSVEIGAQGSFECSSLTKAGLKEVFDHAIRVALLAQNRKQPVATSPVCCVIS